MQIFIDLVGQKFGRLTVIEFSHKSKHRYFCWKCKCDCDGKEVIVNGTYLRSGDTTSCGCLKKEKVAFLFKGQTHSRLPKGESGFNTLFSRYKYNAKVRNIYFDESIEFKEEFRRLTKENCHYCNIEPKQLVISRRKQSTEEGIEHGKYIYNGIDRINNSIGYIISNVVSCCGTCNYAKSNFFTYEEFKLVINLRLKNNPNQDPWKEKRI
jgi:hypothetical protein